MAPMMGRLGKQIEIRRHKKHRAADRSEGRHMAHVLACPKEHNAKSPQPVAPRRRPEHNSGACGIYT
jgi:hypothetical protein